MRAYRSPPTKVDVGLPAVMLVLADHLVMAHENRLVGDDGVLPIRALVGIDVHDFHRECGRRRGQGSGPVLSEAHSPDNGWRMALVLATRDGHRDRIWRQPGIVEFRTEGRPEATTTLSVKVGPDAIA